MAANLSVSIPELPPTPHQTRRRLLSLIGVLVLVGLIVWSWRGTEFSLSKLYDGRVLMADFGRDLVPPSAEPEILQIALEAGVDTLQIALLGTLLGTVVALPLGLLGANNLTPEWVHHPVKIFLSTLRSIPVILLALLFVRAVGLGPFPGVLAIAVHSIGMAGKLYAEECETAYAGVWEAMDSTGATWLQKVRFAIWPQVAPQITSLTLFRFEMNIRDSAVLGFVGAGGIGFWMHLYANSFQYTRVCTILLTTIIIVLVVDQLSLRLRKALC